MYSRVPSKRVAMVSKKVFCGAIRPRITGIRERVEPRLSRRSEPWFSAEVDTKPGRNLDVAPGAPPNPWRRAPSRDTRDSTVKKQTNTVQVIPAKRRREEPLEAGGERMEGRRDGGDGHIYARVYCNAIPLSSSPSRSSVAQTRFSLLCQPLSISLKFSLHLSPFHVLMNAYYKRPNQSVVPSLFGLLHHIQHFFFFFLSCFTVGAAKSVTPQEQKAYLSHHEYGDHHIARVKSPKTTHVHAHMWIFHIL